MRTHSLSDAVYCIQIQIENEFYNGQKIGLVKEDIPGLAGIYSKGEYVVYSPFPSSPTDNERNRLGTIESPLTRKEIDENIKNRKFIIAIRTMCGVPLEKYIQPVSFPKEISTLLDNSKR